MKYAVISQPMAGLTNTQIRNKRKQAVQEVAKQDYIVIDTFIEEEPDESVVHEGMWYLGQSLLRFSEADVIYFEVLKEKYLNSKIKNKEV